MVPRAAGPSDRPPVGAGTPPDVGIIVTMCEAPLIAMRNFVRMAGNGCARTGRTAAPAAWPHGRCGSGQRSCASRDNISGSGPPCTTVSRRVARVTAT
ncbi:hypothetical protein GCM10010156_68960 [Planobispora rosea]|uniref:Uncharacterized protein n=1 Tax=Planobispora rosea TaxID=35762 RepID=A0A8J3S6P1_PLARO|nr:hypothetical protein GCM10010156_68960 [Planobispora rosea]GIH88253.1 hypothetical protein Pro02_66610 [Planobispora rosea]